MFELVPSAFLAHPLFCYRSDLATALKRRNKDNKTLVPVSNILLCRRYGRRKREGEEPDRVRVAGSWMRCWVRYEIGDWVDEERGYGLSAYVGPWRRANIEGIVCQCLSFASLHSGKGDISDSEGKRYCTSKHQRIIQNLHTHAHTHLHTLIRSHIVKYTYFLYTCPSTDFYVCFCF